MVLLEHFPFFSFLLLSYASKIALLFSSLGCYEWQVHFTFRQLPPRFVFYLPPSPTLSIYAHFCNVVIIYSLIA